MGSYGSNFIGGFDGRSVAASDNPKSMRPGEIDWNTVPAATADKALLEDMQIKAGEKYVRYGSMLLQILGGESKGMFGPYDPDATDGRQTISHSRVFILNRTVRQSHQDIDRVELIEGGDVWTARLSIEEDKPPSLKDFHDAFPNVHFMGD